MENNWLAVLFGALLRLALTLIFLSAQSAQVDVGVLSEGEALNMLLMYGGVEAPEPSSKEHELAVEIVELCGRLPLTLAIAGGMVEASGGALTHRLVNMLQAEMGKGLKDETGLTVEERIIASSLSMIKASSDASVVEVVFNEVSGHAAVYMRSNDD